MEFVGTYPGMAGYNNGLSMATITGTSQQQQQPQRSVSSSHSQQQPVQPEGGFGNWNGTPSSTLSYTQSIQPAPVSDLRAHPGYRKNKIVVLSILWISSDFEVRILRLSMRIWINWNETNSAHSSPSATDLPWHKSDDWTAVPLPSTSPRVLVFHCLLWVGHASRGDIQSPLITPKRHSGRIRGSFGWESVLYWSSQQCTSDRTERESKARFRYNTLFFLVTRFWVAILLTRLIWLFVDYTLGREPNWNWKEKGTSGSVVSLTTASLYRVTIWIERQGVPLGMPCIKYIQVRISKYLISVSVTDRCSNRLQQHR